MSTEESDATSKTQMWASVGAWLLTAGALAGTSYWMFRKSNRCTCQSVWNGADDLNPLIESLQSTDKNFEHLQQWHSKLKQFSDELNACACPVHLEERERVNQLVQQLETCIKLGRAATILQQLAECLKQILPSKSPKKTHCKKSTRKPNKKSSR